MQRGEKGLQVLRDHVVEHRAAGIPRCVGGHRWCHTSPHGQQGESGSARRCPQLYCSFVQYTSKKVDEGMRRKYAGYTTLPPPSLCVSRYPHGGGGKIAFVFPIRRAALEVRAGPQPQDRRGTRDHDSPDSPLPGGCGDQVGGCRGAASAFLFTAYYLI